MKVWRDFIVEVLRLYFGKIQNKASILLIIGGIEALTGGIQLLVASVIAAILDKPIAQPQTATWVGFALITLGMIFPAIEVWKDWHAKPERAHPNDIALLARFRTLTPDHFQEFLRDHDFGNTFRRNNLDPIDVLAHDWKGARYEFVDKEVQMKFAELRQSVFEFLKVAEPRIYPHHMNPEMATTLTDTDRAREISKSTLDAIKTINQRASAVYTAIQEFERVAVLRVDGRAGV